MRIEFNPGRRALIREGAIKAAEITGLAYWLRIAAACARQPDVPATPAPQTQETPRPVQPTREQRVEPGVGFLH